VSAVPRDRTLVILWIDDDEAPPTFLMTVGAKDGTSLYFDQHVLPLSSVRGVGVQTAASPSIAWTAL